MKLDEINQKIVDAIVRKAEKVCPGSLALIGVYGSVCTGDVHEKSDLDLMILINDDEGRKLSDGFILDDRKIGYDIYCTDWKMLEEEAECRHAHLAKLMDSEIVYVGEAAAVERIFRLRKNAEDILSSEKRFVCVDNIVGEAKKVYADAMMSETLAQTRLLAAFCIHLMLDAVMLKNGRYFRKGFKRTFDELEGMSLPPYFKERVYGIVNASHITELKDILTKLLQSVTAFVKRTKDKEQPLSENISGTYEEMFSNWRNKMAEAEMGGDVFSSFMNLSCLQMMLDEIAEDVSIGRFSVMEGYQPEDLRNNTALFDKALGMYLKEYDTAGIEPKHFADVDRFVADYLKEYEQLNTGGDFKGYEALLEEFIRQNKDILGDNLTGIYLHGSAVMGCFRAGVSDIDLIVVIEKDISDEKKRQYLDMLVALNRQAPAKGIELSIVEKDVCSPFVYPTPFVLHFSVAHLEWYQTRPEAYIAGMKGTDPDLAAHFTILYHRGKTLYGKEIREVFSQVSREHYLDSIWNDIKNAEADILEQPVYVILNLYRVLAYTRDSLILSKKEGGEWGLANVPVKYNGLISGALAEYRTGVLMQTDNCRQLAEEYARYMIEEIQG